MVDGDSATNRYAPKLNWTKGSHVSTVGNTSGNGRTGIRVSRGERATGQL